VIKSGHNPLVLTLTLDDQTFRYFSRLRQQYFPVERNFLDAHLTLFHQLPYTAETVEIVRAACESCTAFDIHVNRIMNLGNGVAFGIESPALANLHAELKKSFAHTLVRQDTHSFRPHVTIQNKVAPDVAKALLHELSGKFVEFTAQGCGLELHEYLGGPWRLLERIPFSITSEA
jgi:2'-5' RNA ligase